MMLRAILVGAMLVAPVAAASQPYQFDYIDNDFRNPGTGQVCASGHMIRQELVEGRVLYLAECTAWIRPEQACRVMHYKRTPAFCDARREQ